MSIKVEFDETIDGSNEDDVLVSSVNSIITEFVNLNITLILDASSVITGADGDDLLVGNQSDDKLIGGNGDDILIGGGLVSAFWGLSFELSEAEADNSIVSFDTPHPSAASELLVGGDGNDILIGGSWNDDNGDGVEEIGELVLGSKDSAGFFGVNNIMWGGAGADKLYGANAFDTIGGGAGNDLIYGFDGVDVLFGGLGDDTIFGGDGDPEFFFRESGDNFTLTESLLGGPGDDFVSGDDGADRIFGGDGDDTLDGGMGDDTLYGGRGDSDDLGINDVILGGAGNDLIFASGGNDSVSAGDGDDNIFSGNGTDTIDGGAGADTLWGGGGDDMFTGGAGADVFIFASGHGSDTITDFNVSDDELRLVSTVTDFITTADVSAAATEENDGLRIDLGGGDSLFLEGLGVEDIDSMNLVL